MRKTLYKYLLCAAMASVTFGAAGQEPVRSTAKDTLNLTAVPDSTLLGADLTAVAAGDTLADLSVTFSKEYLDTVNVNRKSIINDYSMIGFEYGFGMSRMMFNPQKKQGMLPTRGIMGVTFTKYGKMFGYMPYFGLQVGLFYGENGYSTKVNKETGTRPTVDGAYEARYKYIEVPALAHLHMDTGDHFKIVANLGIYGGYKLSVERFGDDISDDYRTNFQDYDKRLEYGIKGGAGFAIMVDPLEFFVTANVKYAFSSIYEPDYASSYYYRFAYPFEVNISAGVHFQLTRRKGKTRAMMRKEAYEAVYGINQ